MLSVGHRTASAGALGVDAMTVRDPGRIARRHASSNGSPAARDSANSSASCSIGVANSCGGAISAATAQDGILIERTHHQIARLEPQPQLLSMTNRGDHIGLH